MAVNNAVQMALCIECSPAVQEVPSSVPDWDASVSGALCRGCRWPWSSPYIVVTLAWCNSHAGLRFEDLAPSHASEPRAPCSLSISTCPIKYIRVRVKLSHNPQSRACDIAAWRRAVVVQAKVPNSSQYAVRMALCRWPWSSPYNLY